MILLNFILNMIPFNIIITAIGMGIFFFIFNYLRYGQKIHINDSLIAGFSLAYIFLDVLPEILQEVTEFHFFFDLHPFFFIIIGFSTQHLIEKLILQKVDKNTQKLTRKLIKMENKLELSEHNYEIALTEEVIKKKVDNNIIQDCAKQIFLLIDQEKKTQTQIIQMEQKINVDISKDLINLRFISDFVYEFFIGIVLFEILESGHLESSIFFFLFTFLHAVIVNKKHHEKIFTDLNIEVEFSESKLQKILTSLSILLGIIVGITFVSIEIPTELIFMMLSFVAGLILHEILHHMPEKEKGNGLYFILGMVLFCIIYFISRTIH